MHQYIFLMRLDLERRQQSATMQGEVIKISKSLEGAHTTTA